MRYRILAAGELIGESDLEGCDPVLHLAYGQFHPAPAYEAVRPVFRSVSEGQGVGDPEALATCYRARDGLNLALHDDSGREVLTGWIQIVDLSAHLGGCAYQVEAQVEDATFFR